MSAADGGATEDRWEGQPAELSSEEWAAVALYTKVAILRFHMRFCLKRGCCLKMSLQIPDLQKPVGFGKGPGVSAG